MEKVTFAIRKFAEFMRILAVAGTGGVYVWTKDIGFDMVLCGYIAFVFCVMMIVVAFVLDMIVGGEK